MATVTNTTVTVTDDIDGKNGATNVLFSVEGVDYSIDLGGLNLKNFRASFQKYIDAATVVEPVKASKGKGKTSGAKPTGDAALIREWANSNGITVGKRGRINPEVVAAYTAALAAPALTEGETVAEVEVEAEAPATAEV